MWRKNIEQGSNWPTKKAKPENQRVIEKSTKHHGVIKVLSSTLMWIRREKPRQYDACDPQYYKQRILLRDKEEINEI